MSASDLTLPVDGEIFNLRVGAIIQKDGKVLMACNPAADYCYSVGGRMRFGETTAEAVKREVREETGVYMEIDRLGFVHEVFFYGDDENNRGKLVQELSFYYYMDAPASFSPVCGSVSDGGRKESLVWLDPEGDEPFYPTFFRTELLNPVKEVKHIVTDERLMTDGEEELLFLFPTAEYADEIRAYRQEFLDAGSSMDGTGPLRRVADPAEWLRTVDAYRAPQTVPEGLVPATQFICVRASDKKIVGMLQVRHTLNDFLEKYAGHIGYSVRPSERKKGYAKRMLRQSLSFCRKIGLSRVMISCEPENEGSRRTILANGGVYENTVFEPGEGIFLERYWIELANK